MKPLSWLRLFSLGAAALGLSGCVTGALWEDGRFARYREPANPCHLQVFESRENQDVLIVYEDRGEEGQSPGRRAFWLDRNSQKLQEREKPDFVSVRHQQGLQPVPLILESQASDDFLSRKGLYATLSSTGHGFTLFSACSALGTYELPVYPDSSGRLKQVALTPLAVTADLTIVGGLLAYWWLPDVWTSLNCVSH
jgi:hypothetical protein